MLLWHGSSLKQMLCRWPLWRRGLLTGLCPTAIALLLRQASEPRPPHVSLNSLSLPCAVLPALLTCLQLVLAQLLGVG